MRGRLAPEDVGLRSVGRRRTPGLRRQEVAELAAVSIDWYIRLEQGRVGAPGSACWTPSPRRCGCRRPSASTCT